MKTEILTHSTCSSELPGHQSHRLILIFAGWSTDAELYRDCLMPGWDLMIVYDYSSIDEDIEIPARYSTVYLYAWSLGVAVAEHRLDPARITRAYAVNGTIAPVSAKTGISPDIYEATGKNLTERNLKKFHRRMVDTAEEMSLLSSRLPINPDVTSLQRQLSLLNEKFGGERARDVSRLPWIRAYIGNNDRIFPAEAQYNAWSDIIDAHDIVNLDRPHYIPLKEIISGTIHDIRKIGENFRDASLTYDMASTPQRIIAEALSEKIQPDSIADNSEILEIGSGTGHLTKLYSGRLLHGRVTHIDLYPLKPFGLAAEENYIEDDAERWLTECEEDFDLILSASAIQWFADLKLFFHNAARRLRHRNGALICSTFCKGNLRELDAVRPSPLQYPTADDVASMLRAEFDEVEVDEIEIPVKFSSPREALVHLSRTGVRGNGGHLRPSDITKAIDADNPTLTYRALLIKAK